MSALAHGFTGKMFGIVRNWFGKPAERHLPPTPTRFPTRFQSSLAGGQRPVGSPKPATATAGSHYSLELPLETILNQLPAELQQRVVAGVTNVSVSLPAQNILPQLAHGAVKISFGELRSLAPGIFSAATDRDHVLVQLPLAEILSRISPNLLHRRPAQKRYEVSPDIVSPFDNQGQGLVFTVGPSQAPSATPKPLGKPVSPVAAPPALAARGRAATVPAPSPPGISPTPMPAQPVTRVSSPPLPPAGLPVTPANLPSATPGRPPLRVHPVASTPAARLAAPAANTNGGVLIVSLRDLAGGWPEPVQQEIAAGKLTQAVVALSANFVEAGLKQGRVNCSWNQLRARLLPALPPHSVSANGEVVLELPLPVLAPLFLAKQKAAKTQRKVAFDEEIPDLFFGADSAEAAAALTAVPETPVGAPVPASVPPPTPVKPQTKAPDTNYYIWRDDTDAPVEPEVVFKKGAASPGTDFLRRYATPNEIVSRAAALDGVAGALISLPDGLLVASRVPPELNADTLAGFLPQIFARVTQCTRELKMGELNNLNFTVGNVPWKIFRVGAIFFAAFGRAGEALPTVELVGLAAELDRKAR